MSPWRTDLRVYTVVADKLHHGLKILSSHPAQSPIHTIQPKLSSTLNPVPNLFQATVDSKPAGKRAKAETEVTLGK